MRSSAQLLGALNPPVEIAFLADYPEYLEILAGWAFQEWGRNTHGNTPNQVAERYKAYLNRDRVPFTLIALHQGQAAGCASLWLQDLHRRPDLTPWLAAVYVPAERRGLGIGSDLVSGVETAAARLGIPRLYLFTPDKQRFYERLGWELLEYNVHRDKQVAVMSKALGPKLLFGP